MKLTPSLTIATLLLPTVYSWGFEIFGETGCDGVSTDKKSGTGDTGCKKTPNPHRCFRIENMGSCELYLFANKADCKNGDAEQFYGAGNEDEDISPDFEWNYYFIDC